MIAMKPKQFLILICLVCISCKSSNKGVQHVENYALEQSNKLTLLLQDSYGGTDTAELIVIKNQKTFKSFFSKINRTRKPGLPVPEIDFTKDMVVVYCSGEVKGNAVPSLYATNETSEEMILEVKENRNREEYSSTVISTPFCMYKMPLTPKKITLNKDVNRNR
ncbi:MAG: hypothetical protein WBG90_08330 [Saonia sp.]